MLPTALVQLESLPLTPRGKVDRRALPLLQQTRSETSENLAPPQSATEERIADIWRELLSLEVIGRDQHFFEPRHSLLGIKRLPYNRSGKYKCRCGDI